ncbi:MAG: c-type cytochrome [Planctomycetales bacterium]|nr:c-type cytochrome [Planctomycetales bacterium]
MRSANLFIPLAVFFMLALPCPAQEERIPHAQDKPPGPALSPAEAIAKMTVPEGFTVELVASEPDIVNPVAMTIDERGRFWITESIEYPRRSPGPGKDRIKILEDTDADGKADTFTVFMEGLNIPSGIAVGHGGVWIANSPDILFVQDTDGDGKADTSEVVVTGFGRDDTHELPNSLTWGPDGWLYGLNGVFNPAHVVYGPKNPNFKDGQKPWDITCAMFRIHPKTREFQVFCEGTSNPWGIAFNDEGEAFISACVIDHLWHLTETGYYHRQGGPYPPFTWKIESIVSHKHQKAAYCGIHWYDSDAYPEQYRKKLYMGNIHGSCINSDRIERFESTYKASPEPDLLSANDAWFMPVVQKTGPDGCLYILDWYDRYHCYQDANRDPAGIDRFKGRLYRLRYKNTPRAKPEDMAKLDDQELVTRLGSGNGYQRDIAQRLLRERLLNDGDHKALIEDLTLAIAFPGPVGRDQGVFGVLISINSPETQMLLKTNGDDFHKSWAVRSAGDQKSLSDEAAEQIFALRNDPSPRVRLQVAIAAAKQKSIPTIPTLVAVLAQAGDDPLVPRIVWQNLHPLLEKQTADFVAEVLKLRAADSGSFPKPVIDLLPRAADRILSTSKPDTLAVAELVKLLLSTEATDGSADRCLQLLTARIRSGEISGDSLASIRKELEESLNSAMKANASRPSTLSAIELAASLKMEDAINRARQLVPQTNDEAVELRLVNALVTAGSADGLTFAEKILGSDRSAEVRRRAVQAIGRIGTAASTSALISQLPNLPADVQPAAIEALTDRADSATELLGLVRDGKVLSTLINANQAQKMLSLKSQPLADLVTKHWGIVRTERDPARVELIARMRNELRTSNGDPVAGRVVFKRLCAQCHKMYGEGAEVGPDITRNGRASFEQLLSNVFDPSLVIGSAYQGLTVVTKEGRVVSGLPAEDSPQRVVLKVQGDKQEIIARGDIDEVVPSKLSLMPEGIEKQLQPKELHDLFAFITLDKPPEDPSARLLAGSRIVPGESSKFDEFPALLEQLLPGFTTAKVGEGGVAILADYHGRPAVRTHPVSRTEACRLTTSTTLPSASKVTLRLSVASHAQGDWQLTVNVNGEIRHQSIVKCKGKDVDWKEITIDLTDLAGQPVTLEMLNKANDWSNEFGYWNAAEILAE